MAITQLDKNSALLCIDLQHGIVALPTYHPSGEIVAKCAELARIFRLHHLPVVNVSVAGRAPGRTEMASSQTPPPPEWSVLVPELDAQQDDLFITKHSWGAFGQTTLHRQLQQQKITQVVVAGIATSLGVESTARQAFELGYNVTLATDAMTDVDIEAHRNSCTRIFPRLGETGTVQDIRALLQQ